MHDELSQFSIQMIAFCLISVIAADMVVVALFLACEDLGRMFDNSFPACVSFLFFLSGD